MKPQQEFNPLEHNFSSNILRSISHDEFKSNLLPAFNKYLLRSPEIALLGVASILESVSIDLSQYATGIYSCLNLLILVYYCILLLHAANIHSSLVYYCLLIYINMLQWYIRLSCLWLSIGLSQYGAWIYSFLV